TYQWSGPNGFNSTLANPVIANADASASGTYTVLVTDSLGCASNLASTEVAISEAPSQPVISSSGPVCEGAELTLRIPLYAGSQVSYTWTTPGGVSTGINGQNTNTLTINPLQASIHEGTYEVQVIVDGCAAPLASFTVNALDSPTANPSVTVGGICEGGTLDLFANATGVAPLSYAWTGPNGFSATQANPVRNGVTTADNGTYQLIVTAANGCQVVTTVEVNTILPPAEVPSITSNGPLCEGEDLILSTSSTGVRFDWIGPLGASDSTLVNIPGLRTAVGTTTLPASHPAYGTANWRLQITDANGCTALSEEIEVVVHPVPVAEAFNEGPICTGETVQLRATEIPGARYEWRRLGSTSIVATEANPLIGGLTSTTTFTLTVIFEDCVSDPIASTTVIVHPNPIVTIDPVPPVVCTDGDTELTLNATPANGTAPYTYQWSGPNGFSSVAEDPVLVNINSALSGTYSLFLVDANGCTSPTVSIEVDIQDGIDEPVITTSGPTCAGTPVELSVLPYLGTNVSYQWQRDGANVGTNSPTLILDPATVADNGLYTLTVTVDACSSTSDPYLLEIYERPTVSVTPVGPMLCVEGTEELTLDAVVSGGTGPYTYEWSGPNNFFSVNEDPVLININSTMDGSYTVYVTDANGCAADAFTIEIDITDAIEEPIITSNAPFCEGEYIELRVQEYVGISVRYEWSKDGQPLVGINNNLLIINPSTLADRGDYQVRVTVDGCENVSDLYTLEIREQPLAAIANVPPVLCTNGQQDLSLDGSASQGLAPYTYAWTGPNGFSSSEEDPTLVNIDGSFSGTYSLIVTDANGCVSEEVSVSIDIVDAIDQPVIVSSGPTCVGSDVLLSVAPYNGISVSYQWTGPNGPLNNNSHELLLNLVDLSAAGAYTLTVTVDGCSNTSEVYTLSLFDQPVAVPTNNGALCSPLTGDLVLSTNPQGGQAPYTFFWTGPNGFISYDENPLIPNATVQQTGTYSVVITDANNCVSNAASTVVRISTPPTTPSIAAVAPICEGETLQLNTTSYNGTVVRYLWSTPNGLIATDNASLIIPTADPVHAGIYTLRVEVDGCTSLPSAGVVVDIIPTPVAPDLPTDFTVCEGEALVLSTSTVAEEYAWTGPNGFTANLANPQVTNPATSLDAGTYQLRVANGGCWSDISTVTVTVSPRPVRPTITTNAPICNGDDLILSTSASAGGGVYEWIGPGGDSDSTLMNPLLRTTTNFTIIPFGDPAYEAGTWRLRVVNSVGCVSEPSDPIEVIIYPVPLVPVANNNGPVCTGEVVQLFAGSVPNAQYFWYDGDPYDPAAAPPASLISTDQNPEVFNLPQGTHDFYLRVVVGGCESPVATRTSAVVSPKPVLGPVFNDGPYCEGDTVFLDGPSIAGASYFWSGPAGFVAFEEDPIVDDATVLNAGVYTLRIREQGCFSDEAATQVVITPQPATPVVTNDGPACSGEDIQLFGPTISNVGTVVYEWTGPNGYSASAQNPILESATTADGGDYFLQVYVNGCPSLVSAPTTVEINAAAPAPLAANNSSLAQPICEGEAILLSTPTVPNAGYQWSGPNGYSSDVQNPIIPEAELLDSGLYTVTLLIDGCLSEVSAPTEVFVAPLPEAPIVINDGPSCEGSSLNLMIASPLAGVTYTWYYAATGQQVGTGDTLLLQNLSSDQAGAYFAVAEQNGCFSEEEITTEVIVNASPNESAFAGPDMDLCGETTINLEAFNPSIGNGEWRALNGATVISPNLPNSLVTNLQAGANRFVWTLSNGDCLNYSSDTLVINLTEVSSDVAFAGLDVQYCGVNTIELEAAVTTTAVGTWEQSSTQASQGVVIVDPNDPSTAVQGLVPGVTYSFNWVLYNGACGAYDQDAVVVEINELPIDVAYAGEDNWHCGETPFAISATVPLQSTGQWTSPSGATIVSPNAAQTQVLNLQEGLNTLVWSLSNEACGTYSADTLFISSELRPFAADDRDTVEFNGLLSALDVLANDDVMDIDYEVRIIRQPEFGTLRRNADGTYRYEPEANYQGEDSFEYEICNVNCPDYCTRAVVDLVVFLRLADQTGPDCFVPSVITPNQDGFNDEFYIPCAERFPESHLLVFNRWGDKVYENENYQNDWRGTYKDQPLPKGSYYYMMYLNDDANTILSGYLVIRR
ncbi:MAG: gliding motility-associated C-terminal domain-containing protein, partial [Bacteroidota bacterium]